MSLKKILKKESEKLLKSEMLISSISKKIGDKIREHVLDRYKNEIITRSNMQYELFDVEIYYQQSRNFFCEPSFKLYLYYTCISKLPKAKRERLQSDKDYFRNNGSFPYNLYQTPIHLKIVYSIDFNEAVDLHFVLNIE